MANEVAVEFSSAPEAAAEIVNPTACPSLSHPKSLRITHRSLQFHSQQSRDGIRTRPSSLFSTSIVVSSPISSGYTSQTDESAKIVQLRDWRTPLGISRDWEVLGSGVHSGRFGVAFLLLHNLGDDHFPIPMVHFMLLQVELMQHSFPCSFHWSIFVWAISLKELQISLQRPVQEWRRHFDHPIFQSTMKFRYAMVCSSNQNRSMEAHFLLKRQGFDVASYGTGAHVKLPGPSIREPNVYEFGTPYKQMFDDLRHKDPELYKRNGILPMLKRNANVKLAPQRWQDNVADGIFDVVFTFEEKVFDMVMEDLQNRDQPLMKTVLVINLEVKDNHEEAAIGARLTLDLCQEIEATDSWEDSIGELICGFERQHRRKLVYNISFY